MISTVFLRLTSSKLFMDGAGVNAMTASGGWCAPSEIIYDFFQVECATGQFFSYHLPG